LTTAILDRRLYHAAMFNIKGESYRLLERKTWLLGRQASSVTGEVPH